MPGASARSKNKTAKRQAKSAPAANTAAVAKVDTWVIFGFAEGADIGRAGEATLFSDSVFALTRHLGWSSTLGVTYTMTPRSSVWIGGIGGGPGDLAVAGDHATSQAVNSRMRGALAGWKYRLQPRENNLVGVSFQVEPFVEQSTSRRYPTRKVTGSEFRVIVDRELVASSVFAAINLTYQPQAAVLNTGVVERESFVELIGAVAMAGVGGIFVGGELRFATAFDRYWLNDRTGWAVFAGPTFYAPLGKNGYVGLALSTQLAGGAASAQRHALDLTNFDQNQVRLKLGYVF